MTQQPLPLDQFEYIRAMVNARIDAEAYRAIKEAHERAEFMRRSLGQKTRFAMERIGR